MAGGRRRAAAHRDDQHHNDDEGERHHRHPSRSVPGTPGRRHGRQATTRPGTRGSRRGQLPRAPRSVALAASSTASERAGLRCAEIPGLRAAAHNRPRTGRFDESWIVTRCRDRRALCHGTADASDLAAVIAFVVAVARRRQPPAPTKRDHVRTPRLT
jgi:hypothetical protein